MSSKTSTGGRSKLRIARLAVCYVRAFTDTWAFLINETLPSSEIPLACDAFARWENSLVLNNPLLMLEDKFIFDENQNVEIAFSVEVDEKSCEQNIAVLLMAIDSFLSLLASSNNVQIFNSSNSSASVKPGTTTSVDDNKDDEQNTLPKDDTHEFALYVPVNTRFDNLLSHKIGQIGFPAGNTGPFQKWSLLNTMKLGQDDKLDDVISRMQTGGDSKLITEAISASRNGMENLEETEMRKILSKEQFDSVSSNRRIDYLTHFKKPRRQRDTRANLSVFSSKCNNSTTSFEKLSDKLYIPSTIQKVVPIPSAKRALHSEKDKSRQPQQPLNKRSRRNVSLHWTPLDFNPVFTSIIMSPKEANINSSSLRGSQRSKSLYGTLIKTKFDKPKNNSSILSYWKSHESRRIIMLDQNQMFNLSFSITCKKSDLFVKISSTQLLLRPWIKTSSCICQKLDDIANSVTKMRPIVNLISSNIRKTTTSFIKGIKPVITMKMLPALTASTPSSSSTTKFENKSDRVNSNTSSCMGLASERYAVIINIFDLLLSAGAYVAGTLNMMFFDDHLPERCDDEHRRKSTCPLHIDLTNLAAECLRRKTLSNLQEGGVFSADRIMNAIVDNFANISNKTRKNSLVSFDVNTHCSRQLVDTLKQRGALNTFSKFCNTVNKRLSCGSDGNHHNDDHEDYVFDGHVHRYRHQKNNTASTTTTLAAESSSAPSFGLASNTTTTTHIPGEHTLASYVVGNILTIPSLIKATNFKIENDTT